MAGGRPRTFDASLCPNCKAFYQVVKVEAGPETADSEITCRVCGGPLAGREGTSFSSISFCERPGAPKDSSVAYEAHSEGAPDPRLAPVKT